MRLVADLHLHSSYSRATSGKMNARGLAEAAKVKGLNLLGTGDFTHPKHLAELKRDLAPAGDGLFTFNGVHFMLTAEISNVYTQGGRGRRIHHILLAPSFEVVDQLNDRLAKWGRLDYDGRPMFGRSSIELVELCEGTSKDIEVIPAHCLLPGTFLHCNPCDKRIEEIKEGDKVLTHNGGFETVLHTYERDYSGEVYKIIPWYFREGVITTPEHPFLCIKSLKKCSWTKGTCKPSCSEQVSCKEKAHQNYTSTWCQAKNLEVGDFLLYPRPHKIEDMNTIRISDITYCKQASPETVVPTSGNKRSQVKSTVEINGDFCRLVGYYLAEGYAIRDEAIGFSFNSGEEYVNEVTELVRAVFGISKSKIDSRRKNQADVIFYSHVLNEFFKKLFYEGNEFRAGNKCLPDWILLLPNEKLAEVLRGWWRGDLGYTVSRRLANQMKMICIKLGIIPSISIDTAENFNSRGKHIINGREIKTSKDTFIFSNLSFFEDDYGMLQECCFRKFANKKAVKHGWIDDKFAYLPIRKIETKRYNGKVYNLEIDKDNSYVTEFATVHNCWTPWFSLFGSASGFDSIRECYRERASSIHAIETGLSSDPAMNWRLSQLDGIALVSFSDAHSQHPWRLGREATVFELEKPSYFELVKALRSRDPSRLKYTLEVDPAYGKYHFDGHRACNVSLSPAEARKLNNICQVCHRPLTIGVLHRVEELADRPEGFLPKGAIPFRSFAPLSELIAALYGTGVESKSVARESDILIKRFGSELAVLADAPAKELASAASSPKVAEAVMAQREGKVQVKPGYDGVYGTLLLEKIAAPDPAGGRAGSGQKSLSEF